METVTMAQETTMDTQLPDIGEYAAAACKRTVSAFLRDVDGFCDGKGIPRGINSVLHYRCGACVGPGWSLMYFAPKVLLAASRAFLSFREALDPDFARELIDDETMERTRAQLRRSPELMEWMRGALGADFAL